MTKLVRTITPSSRFAFSAILGLAFTLACGGNTGVPGGSGNTILPGQPGSNTDANGNPLPPGTVIGPDGNPVMGMPGAGGAGAVEPGGMAGMTMMVPGGEAGSGPVVGPGPGPVIVCEDGAGAPKVPASFEQNCAQCHSQFGHQSPAFPDLFAFAKTQEEFIAQVRNGGTIMAAYDATQMSDADLAAAFTYFTTVTPGQNVSCLAGGPVSLECAGNTLEFEPLFGVENPDIVPITFTREDGVLVTRGAGRVRGRHEKEGSFSEFHPHYFQDRTYGWIIEDYTPTGVQRIKATYLPNGEPRNDPRTNWRAWKIYGNGNVFYENQFMLDDGELPMTPTNDDYKRVQWYDQTNIPGERSMEVGEHFEFEFGIFFDAGALTTPNSRSSYYTDTFRYKIGVGGLSPENRDLDIVTSAGPVPGAQTGGDTTIPWIYAEPDLYFSQAALNIQHEHIQHFVQGRRLFHTHFSDGSHTEEGNPEFAEMAGLAGPLFSTDNCDNCHVNNGRGKPLEEGETLSQSSSIVFKLYESGALGDQLQLQEGTATLTSYTNSSVQLADGTTVELRKPNWQINAEGVGGYSARVARKLIGLGLLEAIPEETILSRACGDNAAPGISGRAIIVTDPETGVDRLGRIGWKAEKVSVRHQVADAANADIGLTSSVLPGEGNQVDLPDEHFDDLVAYMRLLGVPPRRDVESLQVQRGEQLFGTLGCSNCHIPTMATGPNHPFVELQNQVIHPFSDLLLHDMGPDLADASGTELASEWRTPPLWGLGLEETVGGQTGFLHDGRARTMIEAVLWHGGEAKPIRDKVVELSAADRGALEAFLLSL